MTYTPVCPECRVQSHFYRSGCSGCQARKAIRLRAASIIEKTNKQLENAHD